MVVFGFPAAISAVSTVRNIGLEMISANEMPYFRKTTPINAASRIPSSLRFRCALRSAGIVPCGSWTE
jgi:hypothetical protein